MNTHGQTFNIMVSRFVQRMLVLVDGAVKGTVEDKIGLQECMNSMLMMADVIRDHVLEKSEVENLQMMVERIESEDMSFLKDRHFFIERMKKVVHMAENGDWAWVKTPRYSESVLVRFGDVDLPHGTVVVETGRYAPETEDNFRRDIFSVPMSLMTCYERDPMEISRVAVYLEEPRRH